MPTVVFHVKVTQFDDPSIHPNLLSITFLQCYNNHATCSALTIVIIFMIIRCPCQVNANKVISLV